MQEVLDSVKFYPEKFSSIEFLSGGYFPPLQYCIIYSVHSTQNESGLTKSQYAHHFVHNTPDQRVCITYQLKECA